MVENTLIKSTGFKAKISESMMQKIIDKLNENRCSKSAKFNHRNTPQSLINFWQDYFRKQSVTL